MKTCFCGTDQPYSRCCGPIIKGAVKPDSAEKLMRSRYSAYVMNDVRYLSETTQLSKRAGFNEKETQLWAKSNRWLRLKIINADIFSVEFKAYYKDRAGKEQVHHEKSAFVFEEDRWYYADGVFNEEI